MFFQNRSRKIYQNEADLYTYAISALGKKMRTVVELKRLMRLHVPPGEVGEGFIDAVVFRLKEQKYLDDTQYTEQYTTSRKQNRKFGKRRIEVDLMNKGVHADVIHKVVGVAFQNTDEREQIRAFLVRKHTQKPKTQQETARIFRALIRAGFSAPAIFDVIRHWETKPDSETS